MVLLHGKVVRLLFLQLLKQDIHRALIGLVILPGFTGVDQVQESNEVAFFLRRLVPDVADQGRIVQPLGLDPEILGRFFTFALRVHNQGIYQLQDILLGTDVRQRIVSHGLLEVNEIEALDPVFFLLQERTYLRQEGAFRIGADIGGMSLEQ